MTSLSSMKTFTGVAMWDDTHHRPAAGKDDWASTQSHQPLGPGVLAVSGDRRKPDGISAQGSQLRRTMISLRRVPPESVES